MAAGRLAALALVLVATAGASEPAALRAGANTTGPMPGAPSTPGAPTHEEDPEEVPESIELQEKSNAIWPPWIEPESCNLGQLMFMTVVYAYVLYTASGMISEGSELLLVVPSIAGLVGSVVLPILGAVPDGMMVLFSGLGPREAAQEQVSVGVGALAGSTVMLLTFPWFIAIYAGSVPIKGGQADYKNRAAGTSGLTTSGVKVDSQIKETAKIMMATTVLYVIIQIPASLEEATVPNKEAEKQAGAESIWALIGLVSSILAFAGYIFYCYKQSTTDKEVQQIHKMIKDGQFDAKALWAFSMDRFSGEKGSETLLEKNPVMEPVLKTFFKEYDRYEPRGTVDMRELLLLIRDLGFDVSKATDEVKKFDTNNDRELDFTEFCKFFTDYMQREHVKKEYQPKQPEEPEDEEDPMPEDLKDLDWDTQQKKVKIRACYMMGIGTLLVILFSDPMVDVLSNWGERTGVPSFYVSFVLAPFASNASELLAAYSYASKKTPSSITNSLSSLIGAACMNNTFCLGIFLALCYFQGLAWQFTAETIAIIFVQWLIGGLAMLKDYQTRFMAWMVLLCYPGCLLLVYLLENVVGLD